MNGDLGKKFIKDYIVKVKPILEETINNEIEKSQEIGKIPTDLLRSFYDMVTNGKGIRGGLVVLGYLAGNGKDLEAIYDLSTFIEIFHSAILVHDDFMDRDDLRRGLPAIHKEFEDVGKRLKVKTDYTHYGNALAVCLGDGAFYISWSKLLKGRFSQDLILKASELYVRYIIRLVHGQVLDLTITGMEDIDEEDILKVIWTKSGEYTSLLPLMVGATLSEIKDPDKIAALSAYAKCFGWAFQIQDDYLGLFGNEQELGKPIFSDLREGKNTPFMLHLRKNGTKEQKDFQNKVLGNEKATKEDLLKMRELLDECGSKAYVLNKGWQYVEEGKKYIPLITPDKNLQEIFESLLVYMMERTK